MNLAARLVLSTAGWRFLRPMGNDGFCRGGSFPRRLFLKRFLERLLDALFAARCLVLLGFWRQ